jgi:hypothetical protein
MPVVTLGRWSISRRAQRARALALGCALLLLGSSAHADETVNTRNALAARGLDRPYTMAQLGVGMLTLPTADVCLKLGCTKGDVTIEADFWQFYRANRHFAVGAGATVAVKPATEQPSDEAGMIARSHSRSYFLVEGQGRYYWASGLAFEGWVGATAGVVIVSDRYSIEGGEEPAAAILGPRASTIRTEGGTMGAAVGGQWSFAPNWAAGFSLRYARWFLPGTPETTVFLDRATLTSQLTVLNFGLSCTYRIAL